MTPTVIIFLSFMAGDGGPWVCRHDTVGNCQNQIKEKINYYLRNFDVEITLKEPKGVYKTVFFTNDGPEGWGFNRVTLGATITKCKDQPAGTSVVFNCFDDMDYCARIATHEIGHQGGLEHVKDKSDFMFPNDSGGLEFLNKEFETVGNICLKNQNSYAILTSRYGKRKK